MNLTKTQETDMRRALHEVLTAVNNDADVADMCGVTRQAVGHWKRRGFVPRDKVARMVSIAKRWRLDIAPARFRPDVFGGGR